MTISRLPTCELPECVILTESITFRTPSQSAVKLQPLTKLLHLARKLIAFCEGAEDNEDLRPRREVCIWGKICQILCYDGLEQSYVRRGSRVLLKIGGLSHSE